MEIIPHAGFSLFSFLRAIPGILILVLISYLISVDRKNIPWRTVIIALSVQLLIGVCILKVPIVKMFFEKIGEIFIAIIDSTTAGTSFLFGSIINKEEYIFALNVLPIIIFFSALTSVMYYFGIIQKIVGGFAFILRNLVKFQALKVFH